MKYGKYNLDKVNYDIYLSLNDDEKLDFFLMLEDGVLESFLNNMSPETDDLVLRNLEPNEPHNADAAVCIFIDTQIIIFSDDIDAINQQLNRLFDDGFILIKNTTLVSTELINKIKINKSFIPVQHYRVYDIIALGVPICLS